MFCFVFVLFFFVSVLFVFVCLFLQHTVSDVRCQTLPHVSKRLLQGNLFFFYQILHILSNWAIMQAYGIYTRSSVLALISLNFITYTNESKMADPSHFGCCCCSFFVNSEV